MAHKFQSILEKYIAQGTDTKDKLLGAAFVLVNKDGPIYEVAAGRTRVDPDSAPFTPSSVTWLASGTKLINTLTLMHLVEQGMLTLDEDLRARVPELAELPVLKGFTSIEKEGGEVEERAELVPNETPITLRQLLTHTAGLGVDIADPDLAKWSRLTGRKDNINSCTVAGWSTPLKFTPGEGWYYGTGPDWAGQALEHVTSASLGQYMDENIFGPLGLRATGFRARKLFSSEPGESDGYVPVAERDGATGGLEERPVPFPADPPCESGGGGLYSSAKDYGRVIQEVLRALAGENGTVIKQETARDMFQPQLNEVQKTWLRAIVWTYGSAAEVPEGKHIDHGLGGILVLEDVEGGRKKGSMFFSGMCNMRWWIDPETGIGAVMLVNVIPYGDSAALALFGELEKAVYDTDLKSQQ